MSTLIRTATAFVFGLCAGACATQSQTTPSAVVASPTTKTLTQARAMDAVVIGKSTKADVIAALGESLAIRFDNGYEVWVYHLADDTRAGQRRRGTNGSADDTRPDASAEFVILFQPSGIVAKTRMRPASTRR